MPAEENVTEFPETSESLIIRVKDGADQNAWTEFERIYRPVIFRIARVRGLSYADAMDTVQQVLMSVATSISRYHKRDESIRFRNWLSRITRNAVLKALSRRPREQAAGGTDALTQLNHLAGADSETEVDKLIAREYQRELYQQAAVRVRANVQETTWLAFEMTVLHGKPAEETARLLGTNVGSIYTARSRVIRRLRDAVRHIENTLEHGPSSKRD